MTEVGPVLLDTSVVIDLESISLGELGASAAFVSAVTIAELAYGLDSPDPVRRAARVERYRCVLEDFDVLAFGAAEAKVYGMLAAIVRQRGRNPRPRRLDLQIAATAAAHRLPLVTADAADFAGLDEVLTVLAV